MRKEIWNSTTNGLKEIADWFTTPVLDLKIEYFGHFVHLLGVPRATTTFHATGDDLQTV